MAERKCVHTFNEHNDQVWGVKYSPDSNKVVSVSEDRNINLYDCPANVVWVMNAQQKKNDQNQ